MINRVLARGEYPRLAGFEIEGALGLFPRDTRIIIVEDDAGVGPLLACWAMPRYQHVECLEVHPLARHNAAVGRHLLRRMRAEAQHTGDRVVLTAALTPEIAAWCLAVGGCELPGRHFVLPIPTGE